MMQAVLLNPGSNIASRVDSVLSHAHRYLLDNVVTLNEVKAMSSALALSRGRIPEASTKETGKIRIHRRVASGITSLGVSFALSSSHLMATRICPICS
jgi:hypothetical protein